jgi:hypothetical protein
MIRVFKPGLVGARSKARVPSFDRVTGSLESILIFFLNQNDVVLVKKKINGLQPGF